jgi:hypothetical protein
VSSVAIPIMCESDEHLLGLAPPVRFCTLSLGILG